MMPGTVLISRNNVEALNQTPGHWNHCAIYVGDDTIVQALDGQGVVLTVLPEYLAYDCTWISLIPIKGGEAAAKKAKTLIGYPYRSMSSLWRRVHNVARGLNCVDAAFKIPYEYALQRNFGNIHLPDQIVNLTLGEAPCFLLQE